MKRIIAVFLCCLSLFCIAGCGSNNTVEETSKKETTEKADIDLTQLSSTVGYSELSNMLSKPEDYIGKSVKISGAFSIYHDEANDVYFYAVMLKDNTACCSLSIEFVPKDEMKYPEDFPQLGANVTVSGSFKTYTDAGKQYCTLADATFSQ